jgi:hypothetical protein
LGLIAVNHLYEEAQEAVCPSGQFLDGFNSGNSTTRGSSGNCKNCTLPTGIQYVSTVCGLTTDTQFSTKTCPIGHYLSDIGTFNRRESATCSPCSTPTTTQYVTDVCTTTSNTQFAAKPVCPSGQFLDGFNSGKSLIRGSP